jgi:toxin ParE1/3/4
MEVRWLRTALRNLDEAAAYVARDDPRAAAGMVARIRAAVAHLAIHPAMGRPGRVPGTRELVVAGTKYIVPYRIQRGRVEIIRVLHSAQQWPRR